MSDQGPQSYVNCEINFGVVPVGTTVVKKYPLTNEHFDAVTFYVTRNSNTNPIYYVFDVNKYEAKVPAGGEFILKISYTPNIAGSVDFDYFSITDTEQNFYKLSFRGGCIGPSVNSSIRTLNFFQIPKRKQCKHVFTLINTSKVSAIYQFDVGEEEQGAFKVEPTRGTLEADSHAYITVRFLPQAYRLYSRQLCCLILQHDPILIHLFGICSLGDEYNNPELAFRYYPFPREEIASFKGYFSDSVTIKHVPPPISLTVNYLDFGRIMPDSSCQALTTSFTNHMDNEVAVEWEEVELFRLGPEKLEIPPKHSALYECRFQPDDICRLSGAILNGHVTWRILFDSEFTESINVPIPITLRVIGHSFPKNQIWIPSVSISPNNVILPLSLPNFPSWATFIIRALGHLPVSYKLIPPSKTNFIMKPMIGLIRTYQIVAVQLETTASERRSYIEQWSIELNGQLHTDTPIYVKAQIDLPCVKIAMDNVILFESMQPGTQASDYIPLKNVSYCRLQYKIFVTEQFRVDFPAGVLAANEEIFINAFYTSNTHENGVQEIKIICRVQCIFNDSLIGEHLDIPITVRVELAYTELCALPSSYDCGEVEYGTVVQTCFYIYNFGEAKIYFTLRHDHNLKDVSLNPVTGKCGAKEKLMVKLKFTITQLGKNTLFISYNNRVHRDSKQIVKEEAAKSIFRVEYTCVFPTLQIVDLLEHNFALFSNTALWQLLRIDEINAALIETNQGEIKRVDLNVPDSEVSDKLFYLVFVIKNISSIPTRLDVKRRQVCDCKPKETNDTLSFRKKFFDCPHKTMLSIETSNVAMPARSIAKFTWKIMYLLPEKNTLSYLLELNSQRTIRLNIFIYSVPLDYYMLSAFDDMYRLNMGDVFIGLREPPVFAFWLYNNTNKPVPFIVDDLEIVKLCNDDKFTVLKCLNYLGFIQPHSTAPLLFKFWPIEVKKYKVSVPMQLGMRQATLTIEGKGSLRENKHRFEDLMSLGHTPLKNNVVSLSVNYLVIEPLLVSNNTERMFFVKNLSKDQRIQYTWKPCYIDGLLKLEPMKTGGVLQRKESHPVLIKITSLNEPCSLQVTLYLEFTNLDELEAYEASCEVQPPRSLSLEEFVIPDKNESTSEDESKVVLPPQVFVIGLPITVTVVGTLDRDNCIFAEDQMRQKPWERVQADVDEFVTEHYNKTKVKERPIDPKNKTTESMDEKIEPIVDKNMVQGVLEYIASDAIFSNYFMEVLKTLKTESPPLYSQIKLNKATRDQQLEKETKKFLEPPQLLEVADICEDMVLEAMQLAFHLGPKTHERKPK